MTDEPRESPFFSEEATSRPVPPLPDDVRYDPIPPAPEAFEPRLETPAPQATEKEPRRARGLGGRLSRVPPLLVSTIVLGVVAVLLGLMVFAPSIAPIKLGSARSAIAAGETRAIEAVASRFAQNFVTIDYRTLEADFDRILKDTTGSFRRKIERIPGVIRDPFVESKGVSKGRVTEVGVLSRTGETATVRVVVSRTIQNRTTPEPRSLDHSLELTLVSTAGGWKVADATSLPSAAVDGG